MAANQQKQGDKLNKAFFAHKEFLNKEKAELIMHATPGLDIKKLSKDVNGDKFSKALKNNFLLAQKIGLEGTPALIFTNEKMTKFSFLPGKTPNFDADLKKALTDIQK